MDLVDGQPTGSVRISFGYMSTLEDAQAFLRFIIATRLCPPTGRLLLQAPVGEVGARAVDVKTAALGTRSLSPQEDVCSDAGAGNDLSSVEAHDVCPSLPEDPGTQQTPLKSVVGVMEGGTHIITNLYLYPIKSCAAFEVRFEGSRAAFHSLLNFPFDKKKESERSEEMHVKDNRNNQYVMHGDLCHTVSFLGLGLLVDRP